VSEEQKISQRYRSLAREEPPRHVDEAILAAARRAADARPAPLVAPSGRRWYFPLAAAAIVVLAVAVTMHVERERPEEEIAVASVTAPKAPAEGKLAQLEPAAEPATPAAGAAPPREFAPEPKPAAPQAPARELRAQRDPAPPADLQRAPAPASAAPAAAPPPQAPARDALGGARESARADAARPQARMELQGAMRQRAMTESVSTFATASAEQWLQGIADLKRQGRHDEAERELAEFRKRYPDYRIPEAITEKFEKR